MGLIFMWIHKIDSHGPKMLYERVSVRSIDKDII